MQCAQHGTFHLELSRSVRKVGISDSEGGIGFHFDNIQDGHTLFFCDIIISMQLLYAISPYCVHDRNDRWKGRTVAILYLEIHMFCSVDHNLIGGDMHTHGKQ